MTEATLFVGQKGDFFQVANKSIDESICPINALCTTFHVQSGSLTTNSRQEQTRNGPRIKLCIGISMVNT